MSVRLLSLLKPTTTLPSAPSTVWLRLTPSHSFASTIAKMTSSYTAERAQELTENLTGVQSKMQEVLQSQGASAQQVGVIFL